MRLITNTLDFQITEETVVAIGKFDGIHKGHKLLIDKVLSLKQKGLLSVVFTFDPPPYVLFGGKEQRYITSKEEKRSLFAKMGIDILIEFPLTEKSAAMEPETFVEDVLVGKMHAKAVVAGEDVSFGNKGRGDAALLQKMAQDLDFMVALVEKKRYHGREISSTYVREEILNGNMDQVSEMLGEPYHFIGEVVYGKQLGRTLGMPTANLIVPEDKLLPPSGVYFSRVLFEGKSYRAITNIGTKPTVSQKAQMGVETYIYDYDGNLYGKEIRVELLSFKRPEKKFSGIEELKAQMEQDIAAGAVYGI